MKKLIEDLAWKRTLKNPYTGEELAHGEVLTLHNNTNGKTYENVTVELEEQKGAYGIPIKKFFIMHEDQRINLTDDFMVFVELVK